MNPEQLQKAIIEKLRVSQEQYAKYVFVAAEANYKLELLITEMRDLAIDNKELATDIFGIDLVNELLKY